MIRVQASRGDRGVYSIRVSGHAGFEEAGRDIVCAAVTSAVQMTANGITEVLGVSARVSVADGVVGIQLPKACQDSAYAFMDAFVLHMRLLSEEYRENIELVMEVNSDD